MFLYNWVIFRFHVNLLGCTFTYIPGNVRTWNLEQWEMESPAGAPVKGLDLKLRCFFYLYCRYMLYYYTPSKGQKDCEFVKNSNSFGVFSHPLLVSGHSCFALNSPVEGSLIISSNSSPSSSTFFAFWPNSISFGSQNDTFVFWGVLWSK